MATSKIKRISKASPKEKKPIMSPEIDAVMGGINKDFGEGSIRVFGITDMRWKEDELITTGSVSIDRAIGVIDKNDKGDIISGIPRGRVVEIYGAESSGKTTFCNHFIAESQARGLSCALIDTEHSWDPKYASKIGVNEKKLLFSQPKNAEEALEILVRLTGTGQVGLIVLDSIAALVPKSEIDGEMDAQQMGTQAKLMSKFFRKAIGIANQTRTTLLFTNQIRSKVGIVFGSPQTTPGGEAVKFYSTIRLNIKRHGQLKNGDESIGNRCSIRVEKNKVAPPFKSTEFDILFGWGFDKYGEIVDLATNFGIISKAGSWYSYCGENIGQGAINVVSELKNNNILFESIKKEVWDKIYDEVFGEDEDVEEVDEVQEGVTDDKSDKEKSQEGVEPSGQGECVETS